MISARVIRPFDAKSTVFYWKSKYACEKWLWILALHYQLIDRIYNEIQNQAKKFHLTNGKG